MKAGLSTMKKLVCLITLSALAITSLAQSKSLETAVDAYLQPFEKAGHFSGVVLISRQGKVVYEKAFGWAQAEHNVPNRVDTRFGIASVTKSMTRAMAILLIQQGRLGLQDKLNKWVPDFPKGEQITVEMLLRHRSGIPHRVTTAAEESQPLTPAAMVEKAKQAPLAFAPNERRLYSSAGYSVLAHVLELAANKPFAQLLQEHIFAPAQMKDTVDFNGERLLPRRAQEYVLDAQGVMHAALKDYSFLVGAGSAFSTARDIHQFGESVLDGKYGEGVKQSLSENDVFDSNGNSNGFRCYVVSNRKQGYGFVVITNLESGATDFLIRALPDLIAGKPAGLAVIPQPVPIAVESKMLNDYVGAYRGQNEFDVLAKDNALFAGPYKLYPIGKDKFYNYGGYAEITFKRGEDGQVKELEWDAPIGKAVWKRHPPASSGK
jgi:CubicO group peptidase (beta-lactamase class C family)